jgi:excisionase family DNA binding protein
MTTQGETYQRLTVSEAAAVLGVSRMTVRRMIERGQLEAERVHRPQGSAYVVRLPVDGTDQGTPTAQVPRHTGRTHGTGQGTPSEQMTTLMQATLTPIIAPLVGELTASRQTIERQADQLISQAEALGSLRNENATLKDTVATLEARTAPQTVEPPTESTGTLQAFMARWWRAGTAAAMLLAVLAWVLLPR